MSKYSVKMGHPFVPGQAINPVIKNVATQSVVKNRWPDGSAKYAVFSFYLDGNAGDLKSLEFDEGVAFNFGKFFVDAAIEVHGSRMSISDLPSRMILPNYYEYADDTGAHDLASDGVVKLRPRIYIEYWPEINNAEVRFVLENSNTEAAGECLAPVRFFIGIQEVYSNLSRTWQEQMMPPGSRWSKAFWLNGSPRATVKYDLNYLKSTGAVPNYITTIQPPQSELDRNWQEWSASPRDLGDAGKIQKGMGAAGARPELGPTTTYMALHLFTGDWRMLQAAKEMGDLAGSFPVHWRENNSAKSFYGKPISILDRPSIFMLDPKYPSTSDADRIKFVADNDHWGWNPDCAHIPDFYSTLYMITADEWYLDQMTFWGSYCAAYPNGVATSQNVASCGRGPTGSEGGFPGVRCMSMRAWSWALRNKALTAWFMPDDRPIEQSYYRQVVLDQLTQAEGERNINPHSGLWQWARDTFHAEENNPCHWWELGNGSFAQDPLDDSKVAAGISGFEHHFVQHNLYRVEELGFPSRALIDWHKPSIDGVVAVDYRYSAAYRMPTVKINLSPVQFSELPQMFLSNFDPAVNWESQSRGDHGYGWIAMMAGGKDLADDPDGPYNVKWMIRPK